MSANSLLFSISQLSFSVKLLGSSVLIQHQYLFAAGLVLASEIFHQPLLIICLLPLVLKRCTTEFSKVKVAQLPSILELLLAAVSIVAACTAFTGLIWRQLLPFAAACTFNLKEYNGLLFANESLLQNAKLFSNVWVLGVWNTIQKTVQIFSSIDYSRRWYQPSLGIRWYLDAQMIPEYTLYFELLFIMQPIICAGLIYFYIIDKDRTVGIHILMVILLLFRRDLGVLDFVLGIGLLLQHTEVIRGMHNLPVIIAGIAVPLAVSPLMLSLWVDRGTGNANYFFFQDLCLWLFSALGIVEFTSSFMRSFTSKSCS